MNPLRTATDRLCRAMDAEFKRRPHLHMACSVALFALIAGLFLTASGASQ